MKWVTSNYKAGDLFIFDFGKGIAHCGIMTNVIALVLIALLKVILVI
jgi:uncharacterized protein YijF (DUF1287 family)